MLESMSSSSVAQTALSSLASGGSSTTAHTAFTRLTSSSNDTSKTASRSETASTTTLRDAAQEITSAREGSLAITPPTPLPNDERSLRPYTRLPPQDSLIRRQESPVRTGLFPGAGAAPRARSINLPIEPPTDEKSALVSFIPTVSQLPTFPRSEPNLVRASSSDGSLSSGCSLLSLSTAPSSQGPPMSSSLSSTGSSYVSSLFSHALSQDANADAHSLAAPLPRAAIEAPRAESPVRGLELVRAPGQALVQVAQPPSKTAHPTRLLPGPSYAASTIGSSVVAVTGHADRQPTSSMTSESSSGGSTAREQSSFSSGIPAPLPGVLASPRKRTWTRSTLTGSAASRDTFGCAKSTTEGSSHAATSTEFASANTCSPPASAGDAAPSPTMRRQALSDTTLTSTSASTFSSLGSTCENESKPSTTQSWRTAQTHIEEEVTSRELVRTTLSIRQTRFAQETTTRALVGNRLAASRSEPSTINDSSSAIRTESIQTSSSASSLSSARPTFASTSASTSARPPSPSKTKALIEFFDRSRQGASPDTPTTIHITSRSPSPTKWQRVESISERPRSPASTSRRSASVVVEEEVSVPPLPPKTASSATSSAEYMTAPAEPESQSPPQPVRATTIVHPDAVTSPPPPTASPPTIVIAPALSHVSTSSATSYASRSSYTRSTESGVGGIFTFDATAAIGLVPPDARTALLTGPLYFLDQYSELARQLQDGRRPWVYASVTLLARAIALSWLPAGGGRENVALHLRYAHIVRSLASNTVKGAEDKYPFEVVFEDGVELFAAESPLERIKWVNAIE